MPPLARWCALTIALATFGFPARAVEYVMTDLGTLSGNGAGATAINEAGEVVGQAQRKRIDGRLPIPTHAFLFTGGRMKDLGVLGHSKSGHSAAQAINDQGQVVGEVAASFNTPEVAFLYSGGRMSSLATGGEWSRATGINNAGQVVGYFYASGTGYLHYLITSGTVVTFPSGYITPVSINDAGHVTGYTSSSPGGAYFYASGTTTILPNSASFYPYAINSFDVIVGYDAGRRHAIAYNVNGFAITDLGTLGGPSSIAQAINDKGQVVGVSLVDKRVSHAFLYENGAMIDLNSHIVSSAPYTLVTATGINELGQIVGYGRKKNSSANHAFLLTPQKWAPKLFLAGGVKFLGAGDRLRLRGSLFGTASFVTYRLNGGAERRVHGLRRWSAVLGLRSGTTNTIVLQAHGNRGNSLPLKVTVTEGRVIVSHSS